MNTWTSGTVNVPAQYLASNRVLRNTYALLALNLPHPGLVLTLVGYFSLLFLTTRFRSSGIGLAMVFALTGFMGYTLVLQ
jgi:modulator of FtsH protease